MELNQPKKESTENVVDHRVIGQRQKLFMFHEYSPAHASFYRDEEFMHCDQ